MDSPASIAGFFLPGRRPSRCNIAEFEVGSLISAA
jgi:hypothetical protein